VIETFGQFERNNADEHGSSAHVGYSHKSLRLAGLQILHVPIERHFKLRSISQIVQYAYGKTSRPQNHAYDGGRDGKHTVAAVHAPSVSVGGWRTKAAACLITGKAYHNECSQPSGSCSQNIGSTPQRPSVHSAQPGSGGSVIDLREKLKIMWGNIIGHHIRRCNRNLFLVNVCVLAALGFWGYTSERYLYNCAVGPLLITQEELFRVSDPTNMLRNFVSISGIQPLETGLQDIEKAEGSPAKVKADYFAAPIQGRLLLIKSPEPRPTSNYEGALLPVPPNVQSWLQKNLLDEKHRQFHDVFLPYLVDANSFRKQAYICLAFCLPLGLLAAYNVRNAITRMNNIEASPIYQWLCHYDQSPPAVAQMIDQDLKTTGDIHSAGSVQVTTSWLLNKRFFTVDVSHLNEIVWVYQKVTQHSYNLIPTGKSHQVVVSDKWGRTIELTFGRGKIASEKAAALLQVIGTRIPWVVAGYSEELKQEYLKNRPQFVTAVDERRNAFVDQPSTWPSEWGVKPDIV
jgi:hypothetical protein